MKSRKLAVAAGALLMAVSLYAVFHDWAYDDPFITYRYAQNLNSGVGFVYNSGERVLSTTTPLYAVVLAGLGCLWSDLPHLSNLISVLSLVMGSYFTFRLGRSLGDPVAGCVAALLLPFSSLLLSTLGAETCFYTMLIVAALCLQTEGRYPAAMLCAALATLARSDGVLVAGVLGLDYLLRHRRIPWAPILIYVLAIAPWYLFSWSYFGSPLPVTLAAKQQQGQMSISQSFTGGLVALAGRRLRDWRLWPSVGLALFGWGYATIKARRWLLVLGWAAAYVLGYAVLGVSRYFWYYAPLVPVTTVGIGLGVSLAYRSLSAWTRPKWRLLPRAILLLVVIVPQLGRIARQASYRDPRASIYRDVGIWLDRNAEADATVGALEVGIIGYYAQRAMVGFAGLIQPAVARQMSVHATYTDTTVWALSQYRPEYVVLNYNAFPQLANGVVGDSCDALRTFTSTAHRDPLIVYRCDFGE